MWSELQVHAAQRVGRRVARHAALRDRGVEAAALELVRAVRPREPTPLVDVTLLVDEERSRKAGISEDHPTSRTAGTATTNRPPQLFTTDICSVISPERFHGRIST